MGHGGRAHDRPGKSAQDDADRRKNDLGASHRLGYQGPGRGEEALGRAKGEALKLLRASLGHKKYAQLDRKTLIEFGRERAKGGTGPVTLGMYIGYIKTVLEHAFAVHDIETKVEPINQARLALKHLGLVGKSQERDRRPTEDELARLFGYFDSNERMTIPMSRIIRFAIATAMRQGEICRVTWDDYNPRTKTLMIRDRKDPRAKYGNDQRIPLVDLSGYDPIALIEEQRAVRSNASTRIFPYNGKSAGMAFYRAANDLGIEDLTFHDMRHEGTSRLFEAGLQIPEVALITGHKDWKMLRRYTHLKAEHLHAILAKRPAA